MLTEYVSPEKKEEYYNALVELYQFGGNYTIEGWLDWITSKVTWKVRDHKRKVLSEDFSPLTAVRKAKDIVYPPINKKE